MSKKLKLVQQVCGECRWAKDDRSSMNGMSYFLCSRKVRYMSSNHTCGDFGFSKQAKEKQEKFERQQLKMTEDKRILAKSW